VYRMQEEYKTVKSKFGTEIITVDW
jgi:hypothetical protein